MDGDNSGMVSFSEMLKVVREVRERESGKIKILIHSRSGSGWLYVEDLGWALTRLGYFVSEEAMKDILDGMELDMPGKVTLEEMQAFLLEYRKREGFTYAEVEELKEGFLR